jgi:leader peptidase (prepilin peptidase)/N-methyltransferase
MTVTSVVVAGLVMATGASGAVHDVRERRIPNRAVIVTAIAALLVCVWRQATGDGVWLTAFAGGAVAGGLLLLLHLASPEGMGFGDVKLAAALGALLGTAHWALAVFMLMIASVAGCLAAVGVHNWRRSLPFGLFLVAGALVAALAGAWLLGAVGLRGELS